MARVNIEESIYKHPGFADLIFHYARTTELDSVLCQRLAKGALLDLFTVAQKYWAPNRKPIPKQVFEDLGFPAILYSRNGICILKPDGIYVKGSEEAFAWLIQKCEAGKASAEAKKTAAEQKENEENKPTDVERASTDVDSRGTAGNLFTLSSSLSSLSSNLSNQNSLIFAEGSKKTTPLPDENGPSATALTWRAYKAAYLRVHKVEPTWSASTGGKLKSFVNKVPKAEAPLIAEFYVAHADSRYTRDKHPVGYLLRDAEKLRTEWLTGNISTSYGSKQAELESHNKQVLSSYFRKKREREEREV